MFDTFVWSAGGAKGFYAIGVYYVLYHRNELQHIKTHVGTSVGALMSLFAVLNYTPKELISIMINSNVSDLFDIDFNRFIMGNKKWICDKTKTLQFLESLIQYKGFDKNINVTELYELTGKQLHTISVIKEIKKPVIFKPNSKSWGKLRVVDIVYASLSIATLLEPLVINGYTFTDGGVIYAYPLYLYNLNTTLGIRLGIRNKPFNPNNEKEKKSKFSSMTSHIEEGISNLFQTLNIATNYIENLNLNGKYIYEIEIDTKNIKTTDFGLSKFMRISMFLQGMRTALKFIQSGKPKKLVQIENFDD